MGAFVSLLIVAIAFATVVFMFWAVLREKHEHEEYYIPPEPSVGEEAEEATIQEVPSAAPAVEAGEAH
jgi:hypothetical protein